MANVNKYFRLLEEEALYVFCMAALSVFLRFPRILR